MSRTTLLFCVIAVTLALMCYAPVAARQLSLSKVPRGWTLIRQVGSETTLRLGFALKQQNVEKLQRILLSVSDPDSPQYGHFISQHGADALTRPTTQAIEDVHSFLTAFADSVSWNAAEDFAYIELPARIAMRMLKTRFFVYEHTSGLRLARCSAYELPDEIAEHVAFVSGTTRFPRVRAAKHGGSAVALPATPVRAPAAHFEITPRVLRARYNVSGIEGKAANNKQAVAQFLNQHYDPVDLEEFFTILDPMQIGRHVEKVVGPNHIPAGTEASLDIEYIMAVAPKVPTWFWSTAGLHDNQEPFLDWIIAVGNTTDAPLVHSVSYGDDEDSLDVDYMQRIDVEFMKLGARGFSILFASGDDGVGGVYNKDDKCTQFGPNFPTSSPWVTAVGGTMFDSLLSERKEVTNSISGGGFSNVFSRPSYQDSAVQQFLATSKHLPSPGMYNHSGRGYPDVAAISDGYTIVANLIPMPGVAGTSCSTPVVSGIFALINDLRLQNNLPPMGFLNPFIYKAALTAGAFYDVTEGCNPNCDSDGFCAQPGWDPATGVGTPNYPVLSQLALHAAQRWYVSN